MVTRQEQARRAVLDWGCTLAGFGIILHQAFVLAPGDADPVLIGAALTLLTGPAGIAVISRLRNGGTATTSGPSRSPADASESPPSSSPSGRPDRGDEA